MLRNRYWGPLTMGPEWRNDLDAELTRPLRMDSRSRPVAGSTPSRAHNTRLLPGLPVDTKALLVAVQAP